MSLGVIFGSLSESIFQAIFSILELEPSILQAVCSIWSWNLPLCMILAFVFNILERESSIWHAIKKLLLVVVCCIVVGSCLFCYSCCSCGCCSCIVKIVASAKHGR